METGNEMKLAVLSLQNLSGDSTIDMFCNGLAIDLITDLSRFRSFHIVSYDTSRKIQPDANPDEEVLKALNVDYLIKGFTRYLRNDLVIDLQLINAGQDRVVWAEKFRGPLENLFDMQEEIVRRIVASLQQFVDHDLLSEVRKKPLTSLNAYECWLKGYHELKKGTLKADEQARLYFKKAIDIDPHYSRAYTGMSLSYFNEWSCQIWDRWEVSRKGAFDWARRAVDLDEYNHMSAAILGKIYVFNNEFEKAEHYLRRALQLNPNDADSLIHVASGFVYLGHLGEALSIYEKARSLNPNDEYSLVVGAFIHFELGNYEEAIRIADRAQLDRVWVDFPAFLAAMYFHLGDYGKMREYWNFFLREFSEKINQGKPADTPTAVRWMIDVNPYKGKTRLREFWEYMIDTKLESKTSFADQTEQVGTFLQKDALWELGYKGRQAHLPELKGLNDLALLLSSPGKSFHCTELMQSGLVEEGVAVFDGAARRNYRERILQLRQEMDEAESFNDSQQVARLQREYDSLLGLLSSAIGKGGKTRKLSDSVEKCRTAVTWRIRSAIEKISKVHPELARHLKGSIKTGVFCEYFPEHRMNWNV